MGGWVQQQAARRRQWAADPEENDMKEVKNAEEAAGSSVSTMMNCELAEEEEMGMKYKWEVEEGDDEEEKEEEIFRMYEFKVRRCMRGRSHDWTECPFAHPGEKARRRDPRKVHYSCNPCPEFRSKGSCRRGDACDLSHGVFESWLHPARYRTHLCKDAHSCSRRVCFFAHNPLQLRRLHSPSPSSSSSSSNSSPSSNTSPPHLDPADLASAESYAGLRHYLHNPFPATSSHSPNPFPHTFISAFRDLLHLSLHQLPPAPPSSPSPDVDRIMASTNYQLHATDAHLGRRLHHAPSITSKFHRSNVDSPSGFGSGSASSPVHPRRYPQLNTCCGDRAPVAAADFEAQTCGGYVSSSSLARCLQNECHSAAGLARYGDDHEEEPAMNHRSPMPYMLPGEPSPVTGSLLMHYVNSGASTVSSTLTASRGLDGASSNFLTCGLHELDSKCTGPDLVMEANSVADHDPLLREAVFFISSYDNGSKRQRQEPSKTKSTIIVPGSSADPDPAKIGRAHDVNLAHFEFAPFPSPTSPLLLGGHTSYHGTGCSPYIIPSTSPMMSPLAASEKLHMYSLPKSPEVANNINEDNLLLLQQQAVDVNADASSTSCKDVVAGIDHEVIGRQPESSILIPASTRSPARSIGLDASIVAGGGSCSSWERRRRQQVWKGGEGVEGRKTSGKMMAEVGGKGWTGMERGQEAGKVVGTRMQRWWMVGNGWEDAPDVDLGWVRELVS